MRTDIYFTMTVKPIRKFVNPEMTFFILHYNFPLKLKYVISYGVAKMCLTYFISSKFQAHFKGISVWVFFTCPDGQVTNKFHLSRTIGQTLLSRPVVVLTPN